MTQPSSEVTRLDFAKALLQKLNLPACQNNIIALLAWMAFENTKAQFNPLATERDYPGATNFNSAGVKNYPDLESGLNATIAALTNGLYNEILAHLANCADPETTCAAVSASPWGSKPTPALVRQVEQDLQFYGGLGVGVNPAPTINSQGSPPFASPNPPSPPAKINRVMVNLRELQIGARGGDVKSLQALLNLKHEAGLAVDGIFGPLTDAAVRSFQQSVGIQIDGIVGPVTWNHLIEA